MTTPNHSPALRFQLHLYPPQWQGRVPRRVRVLCSIEGDLAITAGQECDVYVSASGVLTALLPTGDVQLAVAECEIVAWHDRRPG